MTSTALRGVEDALDKGYECTETYQTLTDESVTTTQNPNGSASGRLAYSTPIDADTIKVTFNGTEYTCDKALADGVVAYGGAGEEGADFSEYPFVIVSVSPQNVNFITTETAGTYQIKIEAVELTNASITPCFAKAVAEATKPLVLTYDGSALDKTFAEIRDAYLSGRTVLLIPFDSISGDYSSITEMGVEGGGAGGTLTFGSKSATRFRASADDAYPTPLLG